MHLIIYKTKNGDWEGLCLLCPRETGAYLTHSGKDGHGLQSQSAFLEHKGVWGQISLTLPAFQGPRVKFSIVSPLLEIELNPAGDTG